MKNIILLLLISTSIYASIYECTLYDIREKKTKKVLQYLLNDNLKIYFNNKNNKLEIITATGTEEALFYKEFNNDGDPYKEYINNIMNVYVFVDFKEGARIEYKNTIMDTVNCTNIE